MNLNGLFSARLFAGWATALGRELPNYPEDDPDNPSPEPIVDPYM
jgi:hypothetical protein